MSAFNVPAVNFVLIYGIMSVLEINQLVT